MRPADLKIGDVIQKSDTGYALGTVTTLGREGVHFDGPHGPGFAEYDEVVKVESTPAA